MHDVLAFDKFHYRAGFDIDFNELLFAPILGYRENAPAISRELNRVYLYFSQRFDPPRITCFDVEDRQLRNCVNWQSIADI